MSVPANNSRGSRVVPGCFGLVFLLAGTFFFALISRDLLRTALSYHWTSVPAEVVASGVDEDATEKPYIAVVRFRYLWQGRWRESERLRPGGTRRFEALHKAQELVRQYPVGTRTAAHVNPAEPTEAVLERNSLWLGLALVLPLVFIGFGGVALAAALFPDRRRAPLSAGGLRRWTPGWLAVAGGVVLILGGSALFGQLFAPALAKTVAAQRWTPVRCTVLRSAVRESHDSDGSTYALTVLYSYRIAGREYRSDRVRFLPYSTSQYSSVRAEREQYPDGAAATCHVNPDDPDDVVLDRRPSAFLAVAVMPLLMVGGGLVLACRPWRRGPRRTRDGQVLLRPRTSRGLTALGLAGMALFWNGLTSVFAAEVVSGWMSGHGQVFLTLFLAPFVLIGLGMLWACWGAIWKLGAPRLELAADRASVRLGGRLPARWDLRGRPGIRRVRLRLVGLERATYTRGTDSITDERVFHERVLTDVTGDFRQGAVEIAVPHDTMHTFEAPHNQVRWSVVVTLAGDGPATIEEGYEIIVEPHPC